MMSKSDFNRSRRFVVPALFFFAIASSVAMAQTANETPPNFKIAFIGDQGSGTRARAVLNLIKAEGAQLVLHQGDLDYNDDPAAWDGLISNVLGANFPYFVSIGNHDEDVWSGANGYQQRLIDRLTRLGLTWDGDLGVKSALRYNGIFIILVGPGVMGTGHAAYIRQKLVADNSIWSISSWHKNMRAMQVGGKSDETGWSVYEESRKGGAIIATGHEHSYSRTHLLSSCQNQTVASTSDTLMLTKDDTTTAGVDEGRSFVFVSGLGGNSIRDQERCLPATKPYGCKGEWASIYTSNQRANYGALFGVFNYKGAANVAKFYFKDIAGTVPDSFIVVSKAADVRTVVAEEHAPGVWDYALEQNYPNPFVRAAAGGRNASTTIRFHLVKTADTKLVVTNLLGEQVRVLHEGELAAGEHVRHWDGRDQNGATAPTGTYLLRLEHGGQIFTKKILLVK